MLNNLTPYSIMAHGRSGSHYLQNLLLARLGIFAGRYHKISQIQNQNGIIISIVRNPLESIASDFAKEIYFLKNHEDSQEFIDFVSKSNYGFVDSMNSIIDNADIIVDFDELVSNPELIVEKIAKKLKMRIFNNDVDISVKDNPEGHPTNPFVPSSKNLPTYSWVYNAVSKADISESVDAYNKALAMAI